MGGGVDKKAMKIFFENFFSSLKLMFFFQLMKRENDFWYYDLPPRAQPQVM